MTWGSNPLEGEREAPPPDRRRLILILTTVAIGALLGFALGSLLGCSREPFECRVDRECDQNSGGVCLVADGKKWCAYPDADCESGLSWSDMAGAGLSYTCVPLDESW